jgi:hypothetical protein
MNKWCFMDESWHDADNEHVGVLAAVICQWSTHESLAREIYRVRRKYYGDEHARDKTHELKGKDLFSNNSFRLREKYGFSKNLMIARELLTFARENGVQVAASTAYCDGERPPLLSPEPKKLAPPFRELCKRLIAHLPDESHAVLVSDQRLNAQDDISVAIHNYLAGLQNEQHLSRIRNLPLIAISNVCAGLQFADIVAYIVGRHSTGDNRMKPWYRLVADMQLHANDRHEHPIHGFCRLQYTSQTAAYSIRRERIKKKEPGAPGKDAR